MTLAAGAQKRIGFLQAFFFRAFTVPVRYFIAQQMRYADAVKSFGNGFQRIFNRKGGGMVIDDKGHTVFGHNTTLKPARWL